MQTITAFETHVYGIDTPSYFPGVGVSGTDFVEAVVGIGEDAPEAFSDAVDQIYEGYDVPDDVAGELDAAYHAVVTDGYASAEEADNPDAQFYVIIFVK